MVGPFFRRNQTRRASNVPPLVQTRTLEWCLAGYCPLGVSPALFDDVGTCQDPRSCNCACLGPPRCCCRTAKPSRVAASRAASHRPAPHDPIELIRAYLSSLATAWAGFSLSTFLETASLPIHPRPRIPHTALLVDSKLSPHFFFVKKARLYGSVPATEADPTPDFSISSHPPPPLLGSA